MLLAENLVMRSVCFKIAIVVVVGLSGIVWAVGMEAEFELRDTNYMEEVKGIKLYNPALINDRPVWIMGDVPQRLILEFDWLGEEVRIFEYSIHHCRGDWSALSPLSLSEYSSGFAYEEIEGYSFSFNTKVPYVHYSVEWTDQTVPWTKSGNYVLAVWDVTTGERKLCFTRRFFVVEPLVEVEAYKVLPRGRVPHHAYQAFELSIDLEEIELFSPLRYVYINVYQNMRWDMGIEGLRPLTERGTLLVYEGQRQIVFPGLKEYRRLDMRSMKWRSNELVRIAATDTGYVLVLRRQQPRYYQQSRGLPDRNGSFFFDNFDYRHEGFLRLEYAEVYFNLSAWRESDYDVYVTGGYWGWSLLPEMKMQYDEGRNAYFLRTRLKQGYYDYGFVAVDRRTGARDVMRIDGSTDKTENAYFIFVYYSDPTQNYDRIIAAVRYDYWTGSMELYEARVRIRR